MAAKKNTNVQQQSLRDFALKISSCRDETTITFPEPWPEKEGYGETYGNHFSWVGSSVNTDFALAADCEAGEDLSVFDGEERLDLMLSPMYWRLRENFVEEAERGSDAAFLDAIWRAYNAGRLSEDRLEPRTKEERQAQRIKTARILREAQEKSEARRTAENSATS